MDKYILDELFYFSEDIKNGTMLSEFEIMFPGTTIKMLYLTINEAIKSDGHLKFNIMCVAKNFPNLVGALKEVINNKYPEYNNYLHKILLLV